MQRMQSFDSKKQRMGSNYSRGDAEDNIGLGRNKSPNNGVGSIDDMNAGLKMKKNPNFGGQQ